MAQHHDGAQGSGGGSHGSLKSYATGFILSIVLTLIPLIVVMNGMLKGAAVVVLLLAAAVLQFLVQLIFFMHLREEKGPRYNLMALIFGLAIVVLIVGGSIWIMANNQLVY